MKPSSKLDAIDQLVGLFNNAEEFVEAFLKSTLFFPQEAVSARNEELLRLYKEEEKIHVRYSPSFKKEWGIKNMKEAKALSRTKKVSLKGYPSFNVLVDNDGNTKVRKLIKENLGQEVSVGQKSTIRNYTISHVWGMANHPLFFSSLWNVVLIPTHFNYLMDKSDETHPMVKKVKDAIKQKCIELYDPYNAFIKQFPEATDLVTEFGDSYNGVNSSFDVQFIPQRAVEKEDLSITQNDKQEIQRLLQSIGKSFFVEYIDHYLQGEDLKKVVPIGEITYKSYHTRVSKMKKIVEEGLEIKALKLIVEKENTRLDTDTLDKAAELLDEYK